MKHVLMLLGFSILLAAPGQAQQSPANSSKMLRHVVFFKFKESATAADIEKIENGFRELPSKIKEVKGFEWGKNNSPENLAQGFTHCFFVTFSSEEDRAVYLPHPAHKAFVAMLEPFVEKAFVFDYWAGK
jgi:hypothetical protein